MKSYNLELKQIKDPSLAQHYKNVRSLSCTLHTSNPSLRLHHQLQNEYTDKVNAYTTKIKFHRGTDEKAALMSGAVDNAVDM
jgi:hypothetical protein